MFVAFFLPTLKRVLDTAHGDWWVAHDGEMAWQFWHRPSNSDPHLTTISIHIQGEIHWPHPCFLYTYIYILCVYIVIYVYTHSYMYGSVVESFGSMSCYHPHCTLETGSMSMFLWFVALCLA